jgi:hypothetical protein
MPANAPRPFVPWPTPERLRALPDTLPRLSDPARGPHINELCETLTKALREPVQLTPGSAEDLVGTSHHAAFEALVATRTSEMTGLLHRQIAPFDAPPFVRDIDTDAVLKIAAATALNTDDPGNIDALVTAFRLLADLRAEPGPVPRRGRVPIEDAASRLVAVVVAYHQRHGVTVRAGSSNWGVSRAMFFEERSRISDDEVSPRSPTAELLVAIRDALGLKVSKRTLGGLLNTMMAKLAREGGRNAGPQDWPEMTWEI